MSNEEEERCKCGDPIWADTEDMKEPRCYECFISSLEEKDKRIRELEKSLQAYRRFILQKALADDFNKFLVRDEKAVQTLAKFSEKGGGDGL